MKHLKLIGGLSLSIATLCSSIPADAEILHNGCRFPAGTRDVNCNFSQKAYGGKTLTGDWAQSNFTGAYLANASLEGNFKRAVFEFANMANVTITDTASIRDASFRIANLHNAVIEADDMRGADFFAARLEGARIDARLDGGRFDGANARNAILNGIRGTFVGADLRGARLSGGFQGSDFGGAKVAGIQLAQDFRLPGAVMPNGRICLGGSGRTCRTRFPVLQLMSSTEFFERQGVHHHTRAVQGQQRVFQMAFAGIKYGEYPDLPYRVEFRDDDMDLHFLEKDSYEFDIRDVNVMLVSNGLRFMCLQSQSCITLHDRENGNVTDTSLTVYTLVTSDSGIVSTLRQGLELYKDAIIAWRTHARVAITDDDNDMHRDIGRKISELHSRAIAMEYDHSGQCWLWAKDGADEYLLPMVDVSFNAHANRVSASCSASAGECMLLRDYTGNNGYSFRQVADADRIYRVFNNDQPNATQAQQKLMDIKALCQSL